MALTTATILVSVGLTAFLAYLNASRSLEDSLGAELLAIVNTGAPLIDGDLHELIYAAEDSTIAFAEEFELIRLRLDAIRSANGLPDHGSPIYTMRAGEGYKRSRNLEFVVMPDKDKHGNYFVGNRYRAQPHNRAALAGRSAISPIYHDSEGSWISAAAPIRNEAGEIVGLLQADRSVDFFYQHTLREFYTLLGYGALATLMGSALAFVFSRGLTAPIRQLVEATQAFADMHFGHRVRLHRSDELGDLGNAFNRMADQLEKHTEEADLARRDAEKAARSKSDLLSRMSEEMPVPIQTIVGATESLEGCALPDKAAEHIAVIGEAANLSLSLIETIVYCSSLDAAEIDFDNAVFDPVKLVDELIEDFQAGAREAGLHLFSVHHNDAPRNLEGDSKRVRNVIFSLLDNAIRFTQQGYVSITVGSEMDFLGQQRALFRISDTGPGIDAARLEHIFDRMQRDDQSAPSEHRGAGLGLHMASQLAAQMNGELTVRSTEGKGSTFSVTFPLHRDLQDEGK